MGVKDMFLNAPLISKMAKASRTAAAALLIPVSGMAASITLEWDANTEPDLAGYWIYYAPKSLLKLTPTQADADSSVTKIYVAAPATTYTISSLPEGQAYFFRLMAEDTSGNKSGFNVVSGGNRAGADTELAVTLGDYVKAPETFLSPSLQDGVNDSATFGTLAQAVSIYDISGRRVFEQNQDALGGAQIVWNGRDTDGKVVESGVYIASIKKKDGGVIHQKLAVVK
jgi:hypothetical protein